MILNNDKIKKLEETAQRTLNILALIKKQKTVGEIARAVNCDRQLVEYYLKAIRKEQV